MGRWQKGQDKPHTAVTVTLPSLKISQLTSWKVLELLAPCPVPQFSHGIQENSAATFSKPQALSCLWRNKNLGVQSRPCLSLHS